MTSAAALLDRAVELSAQPQGWIPTWDIYHYRGRVRMAQGRLRDAMADLRIAVRLARGWRWNAPPDDASRMGTEGWLELVHSALVEAGNRLYLETHDAALIRETFEAAEENRASSLRAVLSRGTQARYLRIAARLLGNSDPSAARRSAGSARAGRREPGNGRRRPRRTGADGSGARPRRGAACRPLCSTAPARRWMPTPRCSVFSWATASPGCGPWIATVSHSTPCRPRCRGGIAGASGRRTPSAADAAPVDGAPSQLSRTLFGQLAPRFQGKTRWLVALDRGSTLTDSQGRFTAGGLAFEAPLAALQDSSRNSPETYLAERHVIEMIPGAAYWVEAGSRVRQAPAPVFVGVGDAIYNTADTRLPPLPRGRAGVEARADAAAAGGKRRGTRRLLAKLAAANACC